MLQASLATENGKAESESPLLAEVGFVIGQFRGRAVAGRVVADSGLVGVWIPEAPMCSTHDLRRSKSWLFSGRYGVIVVVTKRVQSCREMWNQAAGLP